MASPDTEFFRQGPFARQSIPWLHDTGCDQMPDLLNNDLSRLFEFNFLEILISCGASSGISNLTGNLND
jgi:hypothetical protein